MSALTHQVALVSDSQAVSFSHVSTVAAALQKQATRDFGPLWQVNATVSAFATLEDVPVDYWPVILRDDINQPGAAGYHTDESGQPFALVQVDANWPLTASHETLEMLADPFGNRTIAGAPPPQAPAPISKMKRVTYLVEVCDPCEAGTNGYSVNGITVSDFLTPHYYDPNTQAGTRYSFQGSITAPHQVLEQGYVSFGNPADNHWYQIMVDNGKVSLNDLGQLQRNGRSLREVIDARVREMRKTKHYRTKAATMARAAGAAETGYEDIGKGRADAIRQVIKKL